MRIDPERLTRHIQTIANSPRPTGSKELDQARQYVTAQFEDSGWQVTPHAFAAQDESGTDLQGINLIARHPNLSRSDGPQFVVGAHVDSRPESPGADDNASAVATLLELARLLPEIISENPSVSLELIGFDLEENGMLGGTEHAKKCRAGNVELVGMISLEMLGYRDATPGAQSLPKQLAGLYPNTGDFIAVIGNQNSGELIEAFANGLREVDTLPVETLQVPENGNFLQATRLSDHSPFWDAGYAALMLTDTSFMRNPHYHMPSDTYDTLDLDFLSLVSQGCLFAVEQILRS